MYECTKGDTDSRSAAASDRATLTALMCRIQTRDTLALRQLRACTADRLREVVGAICPEGTEEILADIYAQVWRIAASYDACRSAPLHWLVILARTRAIDRTRRLAASESDRGLEDTFSAERLLERDVIDPEQVAAQDEEAALVHAALRQLAANERLVIALTYLQGLTQGEVCTATGLPLGTVKTLIKRSRLRLRDILEPVLGRTSAQGGDIQAEACVA